MAKPLIIAKKAGPNWTVYYKNEDTADSHIIAVLGSPTIDDALSEAKTALAEKRISYTITSIILDQATPSR